MECKCHCGAVTIAIPELPSKLNRCSCSICRRYGALWGYFVPDQVRITGETDTYVWGDRMIVFHRCRECGVLTHWASNGEDFGKMGVNMQNMDVSGLIGIPQQDTHAPEA